MAKPEILSACTTDREAFVHSRATDWWRGWEPNAFCRAHPRSGTAIKLSQDGRDVASSPSLPIAKLEDEGRGLLDLGKVQKEFAGGKGPLWAERAGARESLEVLSCANPHGSTSPGRQIVHGTISNWPLFLNLMAVPSPQGK